MHNSLKFTIGNVIPIQGESGPISGIWVNHIRSETIEKWVKGGWKEGSLSVDTYTEGHHPPVEFQVPEGKAIRVMYNPAISLKGNTPFNICTRESTPEELILSNHDRFPILIDKK